MRIAGALLWVLLLLPTAATFSFAQAGDPPLQPIEALIRARKYEPALDAIQSQLSQFPRDYHLWALQGIVLSLQGKSAQALVAFDKSLGISPGYLAALKGKAQLLYQNEDKGVIPVLDKILSRDANDLTAHEMLAMAEEKAGNCPAAIPQFVASSGRIDDHPASLEAFAKCLVAAGQPERAIPVLESLAKLLPGQSYPKYDIGLLLVQTRQYQAAVTVLAPLLQTEPADADLLSLASEAYEAMGDTPQAVALLRQAIVLSPATPGYYASFASLCLNHDSFQVGVDMVSAGLERLPAEASLYLARGMLYAQLAQYDHAEADFKQAEQLDARQSIAAYALSLAQVQSNQPEAAMNQVRSQLKLHPQSALLHFLLARLLFDQSAESGDTNEALREAQAAIKFDPHLPQAQDLLASLYLRLNKWDLAAAESRLVLERDPSDQAAMYHLIVALRHAETPASREEIQALVKRLSQAKNTARQEETDRKRFKFVEAAPQQAQTP